MARLFLIVAITLLSSYDTCAQVTSYKLERRTTFNQEPNGSGYYISTDFTAVVEMVSDVDGVAFEVTGPSALPGPFPLTREGAFHKFTSAAGELLEVFPLGQYEFAASGALLGSMAATIDDVTPRFEAAPYFSNYEHYENRYAGDPVTIQVSGFTPMSGATRNYASYALYESDGLNNSVLLTSGVHDGTAPFEFGLTAGITRPDRSYSFSTNFFSEIVTPNAGFNGATEIYSSVGSSGSSFNVYPVPEPAALLLGSVVVACLWQTRRLRRPPV